jgi:hypothetical protein
VACLGSATDPASIALKARLTALNQSQFPRPKTHSRVILTTPWGRPADVPRPDFGFEYDFEKYDLNELGRIFGLPQWEIANRCVTWVRKWDQNVKSMYDFGDRRKRGDTSDYRIGTQDEYHSFGTYLTWHAMALVGGQLLLERPLNEPCRDEDPWNEWLRKYSVTRADGLWLSDGCDRYPLVALNDLMLDKAEEELPVSDRAVLLSLADIDGNLRIGELLTVAASWNSPDKVRVSIISALVPGLEADLAARALATTPAFHMWLPTLRHYEDDDDFDSAEYAPAEPWISSGEAYVYLDDGDPRGSKAALERFHMTPKIRRRFRLSSKDSWSARWARPRTKLAFRAGAWGIHTGMGRGAQKEQANALSVDTKFLVHVLKSTDRSLLLLIKLEHYRERQRYDQSGQGGEFTHSWVVAVIDQSLNVRLHEASAADLDIVSKLPEPSRFSFRERAQALAGN